MANRGTIEEHYRITILGVDSIRGTPLEVDMGFPIIVCISLLGIVMVDNSLIYCPIGDNSYHNGCNNSCVITEILINNIIICNPITTPIRNQPSMQQTTPIMGRDGYCMRGNSRWNSINQMCLLMQRLYVVCR